MVAMVNELPWSSVTTGTVIYGHVIIRPLVKLRSPVRRERHFQVKQVVCQPLFTRI